MNPLAWLRRHFDANLDDDDAYLEQLQAWQDQRIPVRFLEARTVRIVVDLRGCRWPCPRLDDVGRECVAVADLAEPHNTCYRIANVHLLPGELTPTGEGGA